MAELPQSVQDSIESTKVDYRQLGKSGLRVSVPILGAMSFGDKEWMDWVIGEEQVWMDSIQSIQPNAKPPKALPILKAAYDMGINTWDTANVYSNGASEEIVGKALKHYEIPRHKVVIMTKCFSTVGETKDVSSTTLFPQAHRSKDYINQYGLSRQAILTAVDASLQRLQTTYIDLYQIHRFDPSVPLEETMSTLHSLIQSGKVRYIGASSMWAHQFALMQFCAEKNGWSKFVSMQNHYNLLYREEEREMNNFCNLTGVGLIPWAPLAAGKLARPVAQAEDSTRAQFQQRNAARFRAVRLTYRMSENEEQIVNRVEEVAKKRGWKMGHVAQAWISKRVTSPIIGFSSVERLQEAADARGKSLTDEEERYLEELYVVKPVSGHS